MPLRECDLALWLLKSDTRNIRKRNKNILDLVFILLLKNAQLLVIIVCNLYQLYKKSKKS